MGTPAACNQIMEAMFGDGHIEEWFGYGGEPHHFRALVGNGSPIGVEVLAEFRRALDQVKRLSSWLDEIIITLPTAYGKAPIVSRLGPRMGRAAPPPYRPRLPAGNFPAATLLGVRYSTVTLPMAEEHKGGQQNGL